MEVLHRIAEEFEKRKDDLLVFALLLGFGFFINRGVELKGLYMDDLYLWSCYGEQSFREFVFPMGGTGSGSSFTWRRGWSCFSWGTM